jgi:hypothetical protein
LAIAAAAILASTGGVEGGATTLRLADFSVPSGLVIP